MKNIMTTYSLLFTKYSSVFLLSLITVACGGDSSEDGIPAPTGGIPAPTDGIPAPTDGIPAPTNDAPTADAGVDQVVNGGELVQLSGTATDLESSVTVEWIQVQGLPVSLTDYLITNPTFLSPSVTSTEVLAFDFIVTDSGLISTTDRISITLNSAAVSNLVPRGNWRISQKRLDYDNNGTFEGVMVYEYDVFGQLSNINYTYVDDNEPDFGDNTSAFFIGDNTLNGTEIFTYDNQNRLIEYRGIQDEEETIFSYEYSEGMKLSLFSFNGSSLHLTVNFEYEGNFISSYSSNEFISVSQSYEYDTKGRVFSKVDPNNIKTEYIWSDDNQLLNWKSIDIDFDDEDEISFIYTDGRVSSRNVFAWEDAVTESYVYDSNNLPVRTNYDYDFTGDIEIVTETEWENSSCFVSHIWAPLTEPQAAFSLQSIPEGTEVGTGWHWGGCIQVD